MRVRIRQGIVTDDAEIFVFDEWDGKTHVMEPSGDMFNAVHIKEGERLGRKWIGTEISPEYCAIAQERVDAERRQLKLL